jgi:hypothetical protein
MTIPPPEVRVNNSIDLSKFFIQKSFDKHVLGEVKRLVKTMRREARAAGYAAEDVGEEVYDQLFPAYEEWVDTFAQDLLAAIDETLAEACLR